MCGVADFSSYLSKGMMDETLRGAQQQLGRAKDLQERLSSIVGTAEAQDGRVKIECTNDKGVTKVHLDPRAMRMASAELAETFTAVAQEAMADLRKQTQAAIKEVYGGGEEAFNLEAARERREEVDQSFRAALGDAQSEMGKLMSRLEAYGMAPRKGGPNDVRS